jgi:hypothetical protein
MDQEKIVFFIVGIHAFYLSVIFYRKKIASLLARWALKKQRIKWAMFFRSHTFQARLSSKKRSCN